MVLKKNRRLNLTDCRLKLGLKHHEVAKKANISRPYYTNIESGNKDPSLRVARQIAEALGTTVDEIFFNDTVPQRNNMRGNKAV